MDRKLISVALIASALVLVSMVSVGLSYSSVYVTEENTCTITCTYGYGETTVTGVSVKSGGSDLTFTYPLINESGQVIKDQSGNVVTEEENYLAVDYKDTKAGGRVGLNIYMAGASSFAGSVCTITLLYDLDGDGTVEGGKDESGVDRDDESTRQVGYVTVTNDGTISAYGFHLDLKRTVSGTTSSVDTMKFTLQASFSKVADSKVPLTLTIKAIREA